MTSFILKIKVLSVTPLTVNTYNISIRVYTENTYNSNNSNYTINDISINQWFSNNSKGLAWKIKDITTSITSNTTVSLLIEDTDYYNLKINDNNNNIPTTNDGYIFSLNNDGLPILFPLTDNNIFGQRWVTDLQSRFISKSKIITIYQQNHTFRQGDYITIFNSEYILANNNIIGYILEPMISYYDTLGNLITLTDWFTYYPIKNIIHNTNISGTIGTIYYLDNNGNYITNKTNSSSFIQIDNNKLILNDEELTNIKLNGITNNINNTICGGIITNTILTDSIITNTILSGVINCTNATLTNLSNNSGLISTLSDYTTNSGLISTLSNYITNSGLISTLSNYTTNSGLISTLSDYPTNSGLISMLTDYPTNSGLISTLSDYTTSSGLISTLSDYPTNSGLISTLSDYPTNSDLISTLSNYTTNSGLIYMLTNYPTNSGLISMLTDYTTNSGLISMLTDYTTNSGLISTLSDYTTNSGLISTLSDYTTNSGLISTLSNYITNSGLISTLSNYTTNSGLISTLSNYINNTSPLINLTISGGIIKNTTLSGIINCINATLSGLIIPPNSTFSSILFNTNPGTLKYTSNLNIINTDIVTYPFGIYINNNKIAMGANNYTPSAILDILNPNVTTSTDTRSAMFTSSLLIKGGTIDIYPNVGSTDSGPSIIRMWQCPNYLGFNSGSYGNRSNYAYTGYLYLNNMYCYTIGISKLYGSANMATSGMGHTIIIDEFRNVSIGKGSPPNAIYNIELSGIIGLTSSEIRFSYRDYFIKSGNNDTLLFGCDGLNASTAKWGFNRTSATRTVDIYGALNASEACYSPAFNITSDKRIKTNITLIDNIEVLNTINKISLYNYNYIDRINDSDSYGVIGQELIKYFPNAVTLSSEFVPNIFKFAKSFSIDKIYYNDNNTTIISIDIIIVFENIHNLLSTDELMICNDIPISISQPIEKIDTSILCIIDNYTVKINTINKNFKDINKLFIYGTKVNDFHHVNYNNLFIPAVGAIQALSKQVDTLLSRIEKLELILLNNTT